MWCFDIMSQNVDQADKSYTASVVLDGAELSYFGQEGMQEVVVGESKVNIFRLHSALPTLLCIINITLHGHWPTLRCIALH